MLRDLKSGFRHGESRPKREVTWFIVSASFHSLNLCTSSLVFICGFVCSETSKFITCNLCTQESGNRNTLLWELVRGLILRTYSINIELLL
jgi:hypothetical protein